MPIPAGGTGITDPAWAPTLEQVAAYIPGRSIVGAADGYGIARNTFDATTHPNDVIVAGLIVDACGWVVVKTGPVAPTLYGQATAVAAKYTASQVELTYPDNRDDLNTADQLYKQASAMRDDLEKANFAATGADPEDPAAQQLPEMSFPHRHHAGFRGTWNDWNWL